MNIDKVMKTHDKHRDVMVAIAINRCFPDEDVVVHAQDGSLEYVIFANEVEAIQREAGNDYLLKIIKTKKEHELATQKLAFLMNTNPDIDSDEYNYMELLIFLIEKYEKEHYDINK
jgi:hypothetical protein